MSSVLYTVLLGKLPSKYQDPFLRKIKSNKIKQTLKNSEKNGTEDSGKYNVEFRWGKNTYDTYRAG